MDQHSAGAGQAGVLYHENLGRLAGHVMRAFACCCRGEAGRGGRGKVVRATFDEYGLSFCVMLVRIHLSSARGRGHAGEQKRWALAERACTREWEDDDWWS